MFHTPYRPTSYHPIQSSPLTEEPQPMQQIARARLGPKLRSCKVRGAQRGASGFWWPFGSPFVASCGAGHFCSASVRFSRRSRSHVVTT